MSLSKLNNPVMESFSKLEEIWDEFLEESEKRILSIESNPNSVKVVNNWLELKNEGDETCEPLILRFDQEYSEKAYSQSLVGSLEEQYNQIKESEEQGENEFNWNAEYYKEEADSPVYARQLFIENFSGLQKSHKDQFPFLVIVLNPTKSEGVSLWLEKILEKPIPKNLRVISFNLSKNLQKDKNEVIQSSPYQFDSNKAMLQIANGARNGKPEGELRYLLMGIASNKKDNLEKFEKSKKSALKLAKDNKWPLQEVNILFTSAAKWQEFKKDDNALEDYKEAVKLTESIEDTEPTAYKYQTQALFGMGSIYLKNGDFKNAVKVYSKAGEITEEKDDEILAYESHRIAAYSIDGFLKSNPKEAKEPPKVEDIWIYGEKAYGFYEGMKPNLRSGIKVDYLLETIIGRKHQDPISTHWPEFKEKVQTQLDEKYLDGLIKEFEV